MLRKPLLLPAGIRDEGASLVGDLSATVLQSLTIGSCLLGTELAIAIRIGLRILLEEFRQLLRRRGSGFGCRCLRRVCAAQSFGKRHLFRARERSVRIGICVGIPSQDHLFDEGPLTPGQLAVPVSIDLRKLGEDLLR